MGCVKDDGDGCDTVAKADDILSPTPAKLVKMFLSAILRERLRNPSRPTSVLPTGGGNGGTSNAGGASIPHDWGTSNVGGVPDVTYLADVTPHGASTILRGWVTSNVGGFAPDIIPDISDIIPDIIDIANVIPRGASFLPHDSLWGRGGGECNGGDGGDVGGGDAVAVAEAA